MEDLLGKIYGRLTVRRFSHRDEKRFPFWECECECGATKIVQHYNLYRGKTLSCGCLQKERASNATLKHGMSNHPAYKCWHRMRNRCNNPDALDFDHYGGRGIRVSEKWSTFDAFWADMGALWESGLSIDRVNNDGNYEPGNCRWATPSKQVRNRRNTRVIDTPWGKMAAGEAAERAGLPYRLFIQRVQAGWSTDDLFLPRLRRSSSP